MNKVVLGFLLIVFSIVLVGCDKVKVEQQLSLLGETSMTLELGQSFFDPGYNIANQNTVVYIEGVVNKSVLGTYSLEYYILDDNDNRIESLTRTVTIVDTRVPKLVLIDTYSILLGFFDPMQLIFYLNDEDMDGITVITDIDDLISSQPNGGSGNVTITVRDSSGNASSGTVLVQHDGYIQDLSNPEEFKIIVREEGLVNIQDLPYFEYINPLNPVITISVRDMGNIVLQLFPDVAPNTVSNFIAYVQSNAYSDNEFHRVVNEFMIQGGRMENPTCTISGEMTSNGFTNDLEHDRGVISMARRGGDYDSQSSQFFIVHQEANFLDSEYATFGGVISGFNILDYIASLEEVISGRGTELPIIPVYIDSITVQLNGYTVTEPICIP